MRVRVSLLGAVGLGALLAAGVADAKPVRHHTKKAAAAAAPSALEQKVDQLQTQLQALAARQDDANRQHADDQAQITDLRQQLADERTQTERAQAQADAEIKTIPGEVRTEIAAAQPKDGKLRYKGVTLTLGGFAAAESVYRSKNEGADIGSSYSKIPFDNTAAGHTSELRGTARQSRLSLLAEGDITPDIHAGFYSEFDFLAGPQTANSNESNSFSPRIRNLYGTLDWEDRGLHLLVGQNWSLTTLNSKGITPRNEVPPPTIEAQYVPGFTWARQPQVRVTADFDHKQVWAAVSLENPQTTFASAATGTTGTTIPGVSVVNTLTPTSQFDSANTVSLNHVPDVVGKLAFEPDMGGKRPLHLEVYGVYRNFYDRVTVASGTNLLNLPAGVSNRSTNGGGVGAGALWTVAPMLDLQASVLTGTGVGRYGAGQLPDTVVGPDGSLKPIRETMFMAGATVHATKALDLYVFGGEERQNRLFSTINGGTYGFGSTAANLTNCAIEGASCTADIHVMSQVTGGFWDKIYQGRFGQVRFGVQYSYTQLEAFSGAAGGVPKTSENMIFTSFRYYPF